MMGFQNRLFSLLPLSFSSGDARIFDTVSNIKKGVAFSLTEPKQRVRRRAEILMRGIPPSSEIDEIKTISNWVQSHFHYVKDPRGVEYFKSPEVSDDEITRTGQFIGDCDDASGYLAAMLKSVGYPVYLTIIANPKNPKSNFTHIYVKAFMPKMEKWVALDMTARGKPFGWQAKSSRSQDFEV